MKKRLEYWHGVPIIDDDTPSYSLFRQGFGRGLVPRDYSVDPPEMFEPPRDMQVIPESEWDARYEEQEQLKSSLAHYRARGNGGQPIPSLNQGSRGYCWSHSTTQAVILSRAANNQPYIPLSAYAVACIIKNYRDQGGWCGQSAKFIKEVGVPSQEFWPQGSMSRSNDNAAMRENAAKHKIDEDWYDLTRHIADQQMTVQQVATALFLNQACALDFNWWGHSVCGARWVRIEPGSWGPLIWNSWGDQWGDLGMAVLRGSKGIPDGAIAIRSTKASAT